MEQNFREKICQASGLPPALLTVAEELPSTHEELKSLAKGGAPQGTAVLALRQTAGRGRRGRQFLSPQGGLYLSVLLRPDLPPDRLMNLTPFLAVCACDCVESAAGLRPGVKWINDRVLNGKKLAGILTELSLDAEGKVDYALCSIGLNCNTAALPEELKTMATSLMAETGKETDLALLAGALIKGFTGILSRDAAALMARYRADCLTLGKAVVLHTQGQEIPATALDVDESGSLLVRLSGGEERKVSSGEVSVRGLCGYV